MEEDYEYRYSNAGSVVKRYVIYQLDCGELEIGCMLNSSPSTWDRIVSSHETLSEAQEQLAKPWMRGLWRHMHDSRDFSQIENLFAISRHDN